MDNRPVLFDLDQTIQPWDMQLLFANWVLRGSPWRLYYLILFGLALPFSFILGSGIMKQIFLCFLWRIPERALRAEATSFAEHYIPRICYPEILQEIKKHREEGRKLVLCSASPELYVSEVGRRLGFDIILGTKFNFGSFFPRLIGKNNREGEKVRRIKEALVLEDRKYPAFAGYGDSKGDLQMFGLCENVTCVNPSPNITKLAEENGWKVVRPQRPFKNRPQLLWAIARQALGLYPNT